MPKKIVEKISEIFYIDYDDIKHFVESDESSYLIDNLPVTKESPIYDKNLDSINIQELRKAFKHSLRSFAKEIDVHYQTIARWEKGKGIPKDYVLKNIIDKFLNKKSIKNLIKNGYDIKLKEEYSHWMDDIDYNDDYELLEDENISEKEIKMIIDKKLKVLDEMDKGILIDDIKINSNKTISFENKKYGLNATFIISDELKEKLKNL